MISRQQPRVIGQCGYQRPERFAADRLARAVGAKVPRRPGGERRLLPTPLEAWRRPLFGCPTVAQVTVEGPRPTGGFRFLGIGESHFMLPVGAITSTRFAPARPCRPSRYF